MNWVALDIGGANLKGADGQGQAVSVPFPLWKERDQLTDALRLLLAQFPRCDHIAATMTGELADCFETKAEGVETIVNNLVDAADGRHTRIYLTSGTLVAPPVAIRKPMLAAASNWHALARLAGESAPKGKGLLLDIGSTTTDIIPLVDGQPKTIGRTDPHRLLSGELVYTGVERSPVFGLSGLLPWRGRKCPVAQELFATTKDVYLIRGELAEEPGNLRTANGRPSTRECALDRMARAICADRTMYSLHDAQAAAEILAEKQLQKILRAVQHVILRIKQAPSVVVISGRGEFLARRAAECLPGKPRIVSLTEQLGRRLSDAAAAHALAVIARKGTSA